MAKGTIGLKSTGIAVKREVAERTVILEQCVKPGSVAKISGEIFEAMRELPIHLEAFENLHGGVNALRAQKTPIGAGNEESEDRLRLVLRFYGSEQGSDQLIELVGILSWEQNATGGRSFQSVFERVTGRALFSFGSNGAAGCGSVGARGSGFALLRRKSLAGHGSFVLSCKKARGEEKAIQAPGNLGFFEQAGCSLPPIQS